MKALGGVRNSAVASQPCPLSHITADKMEIKDSPKLLPATSFMLKPLSEFAVFPLSIAILFNPLCIVISPRITICSFTGFSNNADKIAV